jgi:NADH-quinone oxidoreductase subunit F
MLDIMNRLCEGKAQEKDLKELEELAGWTKKGSLCGLGKTAPNPILSTLRFFREEYEAHINGKCPTGKCKPLITYTITDKCIGCTVCAQQCPVDAIPFTPHQVHIIKQDICTKCDICKQACPADAIITG